MSTIKTNNEHLTLNADGASKNIYLQSNAATVGTLDSLGELTIRANLLVGDSNTSTETRELQIGYGRTGDGYAWIDLIGDTTYTDYGLRIIRGNTGTNASSTISHRGTGSFGIRTEDSAGINFQTNNTIRGEFASGGNFTLKNNLYIGDSDTSTENRSLEIGSGRTGSGNSYIDLIGDTTYSDYGLRLIRASGTGGASTITHRGVGSFILETDEAASLVFKTDSTIRGYFSSTGGFYLGTGSGVTEISNDSTMASDSIYALCTENAIVGFVEQNARSHVVATRTTAQAVNTATDTTILFNAESRDSLSEYTTSNGRFTAKSAGYYHITAAMLFGNYTWSTSHYCELKVFLNGSHQATGSRNTHNSVGTASGYNGCQVSHTLLMSVGNYLNIVVYHNRGSTTNIHPGSYWTRFVVDRII